MAKQNVQDRGAQISRNAEYLIVREIPRDAAQQRYWTFCEAIKFGAEKGPWFALILRNSKKIAWPEPLSTSGVINNVILNGVYLAAVLLLQSTDGNALATGDNRRLLCYQRNLWRYKYSKIKSLDFLGCDF